MNEPVLPLAAFAGAVPPSPAWFTRAIAKAPETTTVEVRGAAIEVLAWGERGRPGLLLCHGGMAHARWWGHIAPFFAATHRVAALSWSGMGGSQHRVRYSVPTYVAEAWGAAEAAGLTDSGAPIFVGHSFGAAPVAVAAADATRPPAAAIIIDSGVSPPERDAYMRRRAPGGKVYATLADALARFRFAPDQPCENAFIADHIARHALVEAPDGWRWRFDPLFFETMEPWDSWEAIARAACPLAFIHAEHSRIVPPALVAAQRVRAPAGTPFVEIAESHHHIMVDQPLALVGALRALIAAWNAPPRDNRGS